MTSHDPAAAFGEYPEPRPLTGDELRAKYPGMLAPEDEPFELPLGSDTTGNTPVEPPSKTDALRRMLADAGDTPEMMYVIGLVLCELVDAVDAGSLATYETAARAAGTLPPDLWRPGMTAAHAPQVEEADEDGN